MAALWWNDRIFELSEVTQGIGEWKSVVANAMKRHGFGDTRSNQWEAAGGKNNCWVSVAYLKIADFRFHEMVMVAGNDSDVARATRDEVVGLIRDIRVL